MSTGTVVSFTLFKMCSEDCAFYCYLNLPYNAWSLSWA
jgi:hypothetical protein